MRPKLRLLALSPQELLASHGSKTELVGTSLDADVRTTVDSRLLVQNRRLLAGTGCLVLALETAAQRQADLQGKPNHFILDCVSREDGISLERTVIPTFNSVLIKLITGFNGGNFKQWLKVSLDGL
ncbi:Glycerol-3-phosphate phosphatase [Camelus dromedarius]|uniref:Glycerol-3-phosphate phosphatase n=1 Tax=Camelus dromedarius TaxID=9838 RepID=A0A5N4CAY3_CAMDR|nr:Glycerol-3-phosphate phosphatase [Camelus dromedarius]